MSLVRRLAESISTCFSAPWVQSFEHEDALREIARMCRDQGWRLASRDVEQGLQTAGQSNGQPTGAGRPLAATGSLNALARPFASCPALAAVAAVRLPFSRASIVAIDPLPAPPARVGCPWRDSGRKEASGVNRTATEPGPKFRPGRRATGPTRPFLRGRPIPGVSAGYGRRRRGSAWAGPPR